MGRAVHPHIITSDSALGGSVIDHSIRFNRGDNPHFSRTPSSAGNRKTFTWSCWVKKSILDSSSYRTLISANNGNGGNDGFFFYQNKT
mgnify:CR=1 FL=1